jgi:hypothetical protein
MEKVWNLPFLIRLEIACRETRRMRAASAWEIQSSASADRLDKWVDVVSRFLLSFFTAHPISPRIRYGNSSKGTPE